MTTDAGGRRPAAPAGQPVRPTVRPAGRVRQEAQRHKQKAKAAHMNTNILNLGHKLIAGSLIIVSVGGFTFISQRFWSLIQHMKVHYKVEKEDPPRKLE